MWTNVNFWFGIWVSLLIIGITAVNISKYRQTTINVDVSETEEEETK
jgi:hypothetical protein